MFLIMNETSSIPARVIVPTNEHSRGYLSAEQVSNRAAVTNSNETPHERRALTRLHNILDKDIEPRPDVPRGYYLDIRV